MRTRSTWNLEDIARRATEVGTDERARLGKAELAVEVAELMLPGAAEDAIESQAVALLFMSEDELLATHKRLIGLLAFDQIRAALSGEPRRLARRCRRNV